VATTNKNLAAAVEVEQSLLDVAGVLLRGMGVHASKEDLNEHRQFSTKLQQTSDSLRTSPTPQARMLQAESALHSLRDYNLRIAKRQHLRNAELKAIIQVLMGTLDDLSIASKDRMQQLKEIGRKLEAAKDAEELRVGKSSLADCLTEVRREAQLQLTGSRGDPSNDPITRLKSRPLAEAALVAAAASEAQLCAAVLVVDRLPLYNRRYGHEVGDKVLRFFVQFAEQSFAPGTAMYRWTGPAIIMLVPGTLDKVNSEVRKILVSRLQYECETGARTLLLSVDASWFVFPMMVDPRLLINKIDACVS
jgi:GGDEF domain-containing protein